MNKSILWICLVSIGVLVASLVNADERGQIEKRIQPLGQLRLKTDPIEPEVNQTVSKKVASTSGGKVDGEAIYKKYCVTCHAMGIAGAPKIGDKAQWAPKQKKGLDGMLQTAIKGINAMPPKGTCMTCSDDELKAAIQYMLPK